MRSRQARLLAAFGLAILAGAVPAADDAAELARGRKVVRVAVHDDAAEPARGPANLMRFLTPDRGFVAERIRSSQIRAGHLKGFDVLVMPGGSGSRQAARLEEAGRREIREFVRGGGGYVGICAGAYLATNHYDWSLGLINARIWDRVHWARGDGQVSIRLTAAGESLLGLEGQVPVHYNQGPLLVPDDDPGLPGYEVLATFATEVASKGAQEGVMAGTHAIIRSRYGSGRVICFSPHPEVSGGPNTLIASGINWAGRAQVSPASGPAPQ